MSLVEWIAYYYVNDVLPIARALGVVVVVVILLQIVNLMSGGDKFPMIGKIFNLGAKLIILTFAMLGRSLLVLGKMLLKIINVLIDTVRDFFTSKI